MISHLCELLLYISPLNKSLLPEYAVFRPTHLRYLPSLCYNSNIIKATVNDDVTLDVSCSLTKSQKNFSSASSSSNNNAPRSPRSPGQPRRREVTEEEAERSAVFLSPSCDHLHSNIWLNFETFQTVYKWPLQVYSAGEPCCYYHPALVSSPCQQKESQWEYNQTPPHIQKEGNVFQPRRSIKPWLKLINALQCRKIIFASS